MSSWPIDRPSARRGARLFLLVAVVAALGALLTAPAGAAEVSARTLLGQLTVRAEAGGSTYDRAAFRHWTDADGDGCTTRAEVLIVESSVTTSRSGTCTITSGRWTSYDDGVVTTVASELDIDHMIPLKEAWISGASGWTATRREAFANDLGYALSLVAVSASSNRSKADRDPDAAARRRTLSLRQGVGGREVAVEPLGEQQRGDQCRRRCTRRLLVAVHHPAQPGMTGTDGATDTW